MLNNMFYFIIEAKRMIIFVYMYCRSKINSNDIKWTVVSIDGVYLRSVSSSQSTMYLICLSCSFVSISSQTFCNMTSVLAQCPWSVFSTFVLIVGTAGSVRWCRFQWRAELKHIFLKILLFYHHRNHPGPRFIWMNDWIFSVKWMLRFCWPLTEYQCNADVLISFRWIDGNRWHSFGCNSYSDG